MIIDDLDRRLLDEFQKNFPLTKRPFQDIARRLDTDEATVLATYRRLQREGVISRIGAVVAPHQAGWSTLAAMSVPEDQLEAVAALVNSYDEVNHNYEREHEYNLWFVLNGPDKPHVVAVLADMEARSGFDILVLPLVEAYRIDLGFPLQWQ